MNIKVCNALQQSEAIVKLRFSKISASLSMQINHKSDFFRNTDTDK